MKNKKKMIFLPLLLALGMAFSACNPAQPSSSNSSQEPTTSSESSSTSSQAPSSSRSESSSTSSQSSSSSSSAASSSETSSSEPSSSEEQPTVYTVTFKSGETVVDTQQVAKGELVTAPANPSRPADENAPKYRFIRWDYDFKQPITADTVIDAVYAEYASQVMIDDFEEYTSSNAMIDAGWDSLMYSGNTWTTDSGNITVSLGNKSEEGNKALCFNSFGNDVGYKFRRTFEDDELGDKSVNAIKFRLMVPSTVKEARLLLDFKTITIGTKDYDPVAKIDLNITSSEYIEHTISLSDHMLRLWGEEKKSLDETSDWTGVHQDDILPLLKDIEFYIRYDDKNGGKPYKGFLDSLQFVTLPDNELATGTKETISPYSIYTGSLNDGYTVKLTLTGETTALAEVIDREVPIEVPGTYAISDDHILTFASTTQGLLSYSGRLTDGGAKIVNVASSSTDTDFASAVAEVNLVAVQTVDNFEQYTEDGQSYYQGEGHGPDQRSGARGAYFSEYYEVADGTSPWGGTNWHLMGGSGDQLKLKKDAGAHSGGQYICLKNSSNKAMRYMQWELFDGTADKNSFRGSKLGFWAKTNGVVNNFTVYAYSQSAPTSETRNQYVRSIQVQRTEAFTSWEHFEFTLDEKQVYYGFMVLVEKNGGTDSYLYLDDIEVYGANPYATYVPPQALSIPDGTIFNGAIKGLVNAQFKFKEDGTVKMTAPAMSVEESGTYSINLDDEITIAVNGVAYVGVLSQDISAITFKSIDGTEGAFKNALDGLNLGRSLPNDMVDYETDGKMYYQSSGEDARSGARGAYLCDYYAGSNSSKSPCGDSNWSLMGGSGNQLQLDTTTGAHGGSQSLKIKRSGNVMRFFQWQLYKGNGQPLTGLKSFNISMKNASATQITVKISIWKVPQVAGTNHTNTDASVRKIIEETIPAGTNWTDYSYELDPTATYYGYSIQTVNSPTTEAWLNIDDMYFATAIYNPTLNYSAKSGMVLSGTIVPGAATITIGDNGAVSFTCAGASANNVAGTYSMAMDGADQKITVVVGGTTIVGTYVVDPANNYQVTVTVTSVSGTMASYINNGTVFTGTLS